jgi:four helix bundle protein
LGEEPKIIIDQIIRSIGSISSNIAEGFNSRTTKQYLSFLDIARRSAAESENWFYKLRDIGQLTSFH